MRKKIIHWILLLIILGVGSFFRFYNLNWDSGAHLHPDERFLTMVGNAMKMPASFNEYLDPARSTFNPANIGQKFFVYGTLPLTLNKLLAIPLDMDNYGDYTVLGRFLSGLVDLMALVFVLLTASLLDKKFKLPRMLIYGSGLAYALMVLPIQLSHFFATDTFINTFMFAAFYFCLRYLLMGGWGWAIPGGIFMGLALASKLNSLYIAPLLVILLITRIFFEKGKLKFIKVAGVLLIFGLTTFVSLRLGNPYTFERANWLDLTISPELTKSLKTLDTYSHEQLIKGVWYPPAVQWISKPAITYAVKMFTILGIGLGHTIFLGVGLVSLVLSKKIRKYWWLWLFIFGWVFSVFFYQSIQFVKALRYFIFLYPLFALLVGTGLSALPKKWWVYGISLLVLWIWPLMFLSIYVKPNSRVAASYWMYDNLPDNSRLLFEHWDDGLPVVATKTIPKTFKGDQLNVFDQDIPEKWDKMNKLLSENDYYILTSNRGWGSVPTVPEKYPQTSVFYNRLLKGELYPKSADFTSYPSLSYLGIPLTLPDDWADETFNVYDHPRVLIYKLR